jgi:hypothetical protein
MKQTHKPTPKITVEDGMTAEETMVAFLDRNGWDGRVIVRKLLNDHAHRLAEKQREWLVFQGYKGNCPCDSCSACLARDYINLTDPYTKD